MKITHSFVGDTVLVPEDPPPHGVGPVEWNNDHVVANFVPGDLPTITLTGDATGSGSGGSVPTTLATVNSDVGSFTNANITVNAKGLITAASNGSSGGSLELTDGTHDLTGVTKITVSDMTVGGTSAAATLTPNLATALAPGIVQPDGTIITVAAGDITVAKASASAFGVVEVDNTTITASSGVISAVQQTLPTGSNPTATAGPSAVNGSSTHFMRADAAPAVQTATTGQLGLVQPDGTSITIAGGVISAPGAGGGTVTTTGSPASGNLTKFSGATSITNGDLSGDVTTSGTLATTIKNNVALAGSPTTTTQTAGDNSTKVATTAFVTTAVSNAISGVNPAIAVSAATTAAGNTSTWTYNNGASGVGATFTGPVNTAIVIDGFTFNSTSQSLLIKNDTQSPSGAFNGIYNLTALQTSLTGAIFTRRSDYNQPSDINNTGAIPVVNGTANGSTTWVLTSAVATVGTDPLTYTQFSLNPTTIVTTSRSINTTSPLSGGGNLSADRTLTVTGALINIQRITATGAYTYTPTSGTNSVVIELQGGGGGGSGVASPGATFPIAMGSGGGAGAWLRVRLTSNFSGGTGSVGSQGTGGSAGNNNGGAGNDTTFVTTAGSPVTYTAHGGSASFHVGPTSAPFNVGHASGGTAVNGDDQVPGGASFAGGAWSSSIAFAGRGGDSFYGKGGVPGFVGAANSSSAGGAGSGKGAGGGGACALGTGASVAGGNGTDGEVIIWEYS